MNFQHLVLLLSPLLSWVASAQDDLVWTPRYLQKQKKLALPKLWTVPHGGRGGQAPTDGRALQTSEEACAAMLFSDGSSVSGDCTCDPNADGTFLVACALCPEPLQALNFDFAVATVISLRYYVFQVFDTYTVFAADRQTVRQEYSGTDAPVSSFTTTEIYTRNTNIREDCEIFWGDEECQCFYENCIIDGQPVRGENFQCPQSQISFSTCTDTESPPELSILTEANLDICPCLFADDSVEPNPAVCNGGTTAPFPAFPTPGPINLPPSTAIPTLVDPPTVRAGFIPCTSNSDCVAFVEACIQGSCQAPLSPGEVCERDPFTNFPDLGDCDNSACGRANGAPDSPLICCLSGETTFLTDGTDFDPFCTGLPGGEICLTDEMCASLVCQDGLCTSDGTTSSPSPPPVTSNPTQSPVAEPTTSSPTLSPVVEPTTSSPTQSPVVEPTTSSPTVAPVSEPSSSPSSVPSSDGTLSPTSSSMPSTTPTSTPSALPSSTPSQAQTLAALDKFVMAVTTNATVTEIIAGLEAYLTEEMAAAYPDTFLRLELEQDTGIRRRLESLSVELIGTAYFLGSAPPADVGQVQSTALADPQAVADYLTTSGAISETVVVESITVLVTTAEPTSTPTRADLSTDGPTVGPTPPLTDGPTPAEPTTEPPTSASSVLIGSVVTFVVSTLVFLSLL